uniref:Uncharacterized protein n=1 Tax=Zooxanthella nutricula TaxID=1333877 RepID=A0A7S2QM25_9DINO
MWGKGDDMWGCKGKGFKGDMGYGGKGDMGFGGKGPEWMGNGPKRARVDDFPGLHDDPTTDPRVAAFVGHWNLNKDAATKLMSLTPYARELAMREFAPKGQPQDANGWSGKFIVFAANVQKKGGGKGGGKGYGKW